MVLNSVAHLSKARRQFVSISDNAHLLSESRRAMLFMEENERNATCKLVISSQARVENTQLWYTHMRRSCFQCVDKRYVLYVYTDDET